MRIADWFYRLLFPDRWAWREYVRGRHAGIVAEVVTDRIEKAAWVVYEAGGGVRYVAANLYARDGDVAITVEEHAKRIAE